MATFPELRKRFSDDEHKRGKQFERVCKWFLETDPRYSDRLVNVWLWDDWPGRWGPDCGIDLVAEDRDGKNWAIQAKCYDPKYSVTKSDIDKFLSESTNENIHHRLLIATTDHLGKNARSVIHRGDKVIPVSQVLLAGLETAPVVWPSDPARLRGGGPRKPVKRWPHQNEAINNVTKNLGKRGQMISACGTGKTLAALWISERLEAKRTLVLLPSLTLLSQTVSEWLANTKEPFAYLPVCSDDTVSRGNDAAVLFTSDLEYPVTTNPDDIATFLRKRGRQVVFSTYQSSHQIAEAQTHSRVPAFDLVIADEAHRCAGKVSSVYGNVLDDKTIRAKKRLFMTATPRTYTAKVQTKAQEADIEVASMDDEAIFGPVVHQLNFGEAIEKGLLTDYQVVVVGVDDSRYQEMVDRRRIVRTDNNLQTDAKTLAKHVALAKAIHDYGLRRTITFHSRIKTASEFANLLPEVVSWMPPRHRPKVELVTDHVSGEMSTGERNRRLNRLRNIEPGQSAVLTNAGCLSEGIDVPALDGVAFIDPRRSQVDIVQAVGRAIRRSAGKTIGTIVIPVFLSDTDNPDTALSESEFEPVWSILRALRSHDEALGEALDDIRTSMGRGSGGGGLPPKIVTDIPKGVSSDFVNAFTTRVVEATTSTWSFNFGLLQQFSAREGHARVSRDHREAFDGGDSRLGGWIGKQRSNYEIGALTADRVAALEAIPGWTWDPFEDDFQEGLRALQQFSAREGHTQVSREHPEILDGEDFPLATWMTSRRSNYRQGRLSADRVAAVEAVPGWVWDTHEAKFAIGLSLLRSFVDREGRLPQQNVVEHSAGDEFNLGSWISARRNEYRRGNLSAERVAALEDIPGWIWNPTEADYQLHIRAINQFVMREGHARVTRNHIEEVDGEAVKLGRWARHHTLQFNAGNLSLERIEFFEGLPRWTWNPLQTAFDEGLAALRQFVEREGHSRPPDKFVEVLDGEEFKLGIWVGGRRSNYGRGKLSAERVAALEALPGWEWDAAESDYQRWFSALRQYAHREGHSRVPRNHEENFDGELLPIGSWTTSRRFNYRHGKLSAERVATLEALPGWEWEPNEAEQQRWLSALKQFAEREGHITVPIGHEEPFGGEEYELSSWIRGRRSKYRHGKLSADLVAALEALPGWEWEPNEANFQNKLGALRQFANREGHLRIPMGHREPWNGEEVLLRSWCNNLRNVRRAGKISPERIAALEAISGWEWSAP